MKTIKKSWSEVPESFHAHLIDTLNNLPNQEESIKMKRKLSIRKMAVICACVLAMTGAIALAQGRIASVIGSSSSKPTYDTLPSSQTINKDIGLSGIILPDKFSNGYIFDGGTKVNNQNIDESGAALNKFNSLDIDYKKDGDNLSLSIESKDNSVEDDTAQLAGTYQDIELYYIDQAYKFVPPDYKMTEQDKQDEASGKYMFSYGSQKVETSVQKGVCFTIGDNEYLLMGMDTPLTEDDLLVMAKEYIDQQ